MKTSLKIKFNKAFYKQYKKILFKQDPEIVHKRFIKLGGKLGKNYIAKKTLSSFFSYNHPSLEQNIKGIKFKNPIGLSAGFDKNAEITDVIPYIGFGFSTIGSITSLQCKGNPGKRLDRLPNKQSLWVYFGLNNQGAKTIKQKLQNKKFAIPIGVSIAKTNCKETADTETGLKDYISSLKILKDIGNYFVLNISCPNAYGGQPFSDPKSYEALLKEVDKLKIKKPILIKLSPDLSKIALNKIIKISDKHKVDGFICTNLSKKGQKRGGLSGKPVEKVSNEVLSRVYKQTRKSKKEYILIGAGGVFSAEDAYKKIKLGANLVQLITGMIYNGPGLISEINHGLVQLLKEDGFKNISEAVGKNIKQ